MVLPVIPCRCALFGYLLLAILLSACTGADRLPPTEARQDTATSETGLRSGTIPSRQGAAKTLPFADDESRRTVFFAFGEAAVSEESLEILRQNAAKLKEDPQLIVTLVGYTDNLGSTAYNLAVADKRIEAVSDKLRSLGVPRSQIRRLPLGAEYASKQRCDAEACRRTMRRVELVYERR